MAVIPQSSRVLDEKWIASAGNIPRLFAVLLIEGEETVRIAMVIGLDTLMFCQNTRRRCCKSLTFCVLGVSKIQLARLSSVRMVDIQAGRMSETFRATTGKM